MLIEDINDVKPLDWDDEISGKWTRKLIVNDKYLAFKKTIEEQMKNPKYKLCQKKGDEKIIPQSEFSQSENPH